MLRIKGAVSSAWGVDKYVDLVSLYLCRYCSD